MVLPILFTLVLRESAGSTTFAVPVGSFQTARIAACSQIGKTENLAGAISSRYGLRQTPSVPQLPGVSGAAQTPTPNTPNQIVPVTNPPAIPPQVMLGTPFVVAEPNRIALTPVIDGKLDEEEWDPLGSTADGSKTYFEWEPGKLHAAAVVPNGHDALFSFDLDANGWLVGKDNLEVRLSMQTGKPTATLRILDSTNIAGPSWDNLPGLEVSTEVAASSDAENTTYEVTISDPGLGFLPVDAGDRISVRADDPLATDPPLEAFYPRLDTPLTLVYRRAAGLPAGLKVGSEGEGKSFCAGETGRIRLTFNGSNTLRLQSLELRSEGAAKPFTNMLTVPFPKFDAKGRAIVDYDTSIKDGASLGFRSLRGTLTAGDMVAAVIQTSYRIAPLVDVTIVQQSTLPQAIDRSIKFGYYLHSNSGRRIAGQVTIATPDPIRVVNGNQQAFAISGGRGRGRQMFELFVPANYAGTFPVHFTGTVAGQAIDETDYITVGNY